MTYTFMSMDEPVVLQGGLIISGAFSEFGVSRHKCYDNILISSKMKENRCCAGVSERALVGKGIDHPHGHRKILQRYLKSGFEMYDPSILTTSRCEILPIICLFIILDSVSTFG
jgi:hypothetical protein